MKKIFRKLPLLVTGACLLSACNVVQPGKLSEIAGTYELVEYTITRYYEGAKMETVAESERETIDLIKENGITCYFVISTDNVGYYAYKDNESSAYVNELKFTYTYDTDDDGNTTNLIREIHASNGIEEEDFELYVQAKKHTLTNNQSAWRMGKKIVIGNKDKITYKFKRVSRKQDKTYINKKMGDYTYNPYNEIDSQVIR